MVLLLEWNKVVNSSPGTTLTPASDCFVSAAELRPVRLRSPGSQPERLQRERSHFRGDADAAAHVAERQITDGTAAGPVWTSAGSSILQPLLPYTLLPSICLYLSAAQVAVCTSLAFHLYYVSFKYLALESLQGLSLCVFVR